MPKATPRVQPKRKKKTSFGQFDMGQGMAAAKKKAKPERKARVGAVGKARKAKR